jgi:hypothetical protein
MIFEDFPMLTRRQTMISVKGDDALSKDKFSPIDAKFPLLEFRPASVVPNDWIAASSMTCKSGGHPCWRVRVMESGRFAVDRSSSDILELCSSKRKAFGSFVEATDWCSEQENRIVMEFRNHGSVLKQSKAGDFDLPGKVVVSVSTSA